MTTPQTRDDGLTAREIIARNLARRKFARHKFSWYRDVDDYIFQRWFDFLDDADAILAALSANEYVVVKKKLPESVSIAAMQKANQATGKFETLEILWDALLEAAASSPYPVEPTTRES